MLNVVTVCANIFSQCKN